MGVCPSHSASTSRFVKPDNTHTHLHNPTNDNSAASPCLLPRPGCAPTAPPDRLSHRLPPPHLSPPPPPPPPPPGDRDPITRADTTRGRLHPVPPSYYAASAPPPPVQGKGEGDTCAIPRRGQLDQMIPALLLPSLVCWSLVRLITPRD